MEKLNFECKELDKSKIHKLILLADETEWIVMVYSQFGFNSYEEIKAFALKHKDEWMNYFYWSKEIESEFIKELLKFYSKGRKQIQVSKYYREASLNWFPTNIHDTFLNKHDKAKVVILDDNELSMALYAEEYPENFKKMSEVGNGKKN